jgi:hypothetical protein
VRDEPLSMRERLKHGMERRLERTEATSGELYCSDGADAQSEIEKLAKAVFELTLAVRQLSRIVELDRNRGGN